MSESRKAVRQYSNATLTDDEILQEAKRHLGQLQFILAECHRRNLIVNVRELARTYSHVSELLKDIVVTGREREVLKPLKMVDGRTPAQLVADGDDRWPEHLGGEDYCPPQYKGDEREAFLEEVRKERRRQRGAQS
jgi:hypothetical protein